jgi:hypothetical protein
MVRGAVQYAYVTISCALCCNFNQTIVAKQETTITLVGAKFGCSGCALYLLEKVNFFGAVKLKAWYLMARHGDTMLTASQSHALLKHLGIRKQMSAAYHPQTKGSTEVYNTTLVHQLHNFVA